jgi:hypothetical protein
MESNVEEWIVGSFTIMSGDLHKVVSHSSSWSVIELMDSRNLQSSIEFTKDSRSIFISWV